MTILPSKKSSTLLTLAFVAFASTGSASAEKGDGYNKALNGYLQQTAAEVSSTIASLDAKKINKAIDLVVDTAGTKRRIWTAGNGGSAATAEHMAHNFTWDVMASGTVKKGISGIALTSQSAEVTARTNDLSGQHAAASLLLHQGRKGDVLIGISGGGTSQNILDSITVAHKLGMKTIMITKEGSPIAKAATVAIAIKSGDQQVAEDVANTVMHTLVRGTIAKLNGSGPAGITEDFAHLRTKEANQDRMARNLKKWNKQQQKALKKERHAKKSLISKKAKAKVASNAKRAAKRTR